MTHSDITIREAAPGELAIILHHRRSMFRDMGEGTVEELDRMVEVAGPFLARALADGSYHHWLALDGSDRVAGGGGVDRKSTRLNSSHLGISYAVFCLTKKQ